MTMRVIWKIFDRLEPPLPAWCTTVFQNTIHAPFWQTVTLAYICASSIFLSPVYRIPILSASNIWVYVKGRVSLNKMCHCLDRPQEFKTWIGKLMVMIISIGFWRMASFQAATQLNKFGWETVVFEIVSQKFPLKAAARNISKLWGNFNLVTNSI